MPKAMGGAGQSLHLLATLLSLGAFAGHADTLFTDRSPEQTALAAPTPEPGLAWQSGVVAEVHEALRLTWQHLSLTSLSCHVILPTMVVACLIAAAGALKGAPTQAARERGAAPTIGCSALVKWVFYVQLTWGVHWAAGLLLLHVVNMRSGLGTALVSQDGVSWSYTAALALSFCVYSLPSSLVAFLPWPSPRARAEHKQDPAFLKQIAVVVACHKCAAEVEPLLRATLRHFEPQQIVLVDNNNSTSPPDNLREIIASVDPRVNYIFVPEGLKAQALHVGVTAMTGYRYVLLLDDDTLLPEDMVFDETVFSEDDKVAGVGWSRDVLDSNLLTRICKFQLKATYGQVQGGLLYALSGSTIFLIGTCALYRRDYWLDIFDDHPCTPYGEDAFTGFLALRKGYRLAFDLRSCPQTFSPPALFGMCSSFTRVQGYGAATLFKQRALRWACTRTRTMLLTICNLCFYQCKDVQGSLYFRLYLFRRVLRWLTSITKTFVLFSLPFSARCRVVVPCQLAVLLVCRLVHNFGLNYILWHGAGEHQLSLDTVIPAAFLDLILMAFNIIGIFKCLTLDLWHPFYRYRKGCWKKWSHLRALPASASASAQTPANSVPVPVAVPGPLPGPVSDREGQGQIKGSQGSQGCKGSHTMQPLPMSDATAEESTCSSSGVSSSEEEEEDSLGDTLHSQLEDCTCHSALLQKPVWA